MKITFIQIEEAFRRAVMGESVRSLARGLGVDESTLREHFKKGATPKQVRALARQKAYADHAREQLDEAGRREVDKIVERERAARAATPES